MSTTARIQLIEDRIESGFAPASGLHQFAVLDPYQLIGFFRFIPMMGGKQDGPPARLGADILDHEGGRRGIKPFGRLVEDVDIRRCDKQTSNPQSPPFST